MNFIDLDNSYIYNHPFKENACRLTIKSVLLNVSKKKYYYLTKECRAELIGVNPFDHASKSEICNVFDSDNNCLKFREIKSIQMKDFKNFYPKVKNEINNEILIKMCDYKVIDFSNVNKKIKERTLKSLFSKITYEYQNKEFIIFNKVEYLNFDGVKNNQREYLQPTYGYVPFLRDDKIYISYFAKYLERDMQGNLEFRIRTNQKLSRLIPYSSNFIYNLIKKILFFSSPIIKIPQFYEKISIKKSKIEFYEKTSK